LLHFCYIESHSNLPQTHSMNIQHSFSYLNLYNSEYESHRWNCIPFLIQDAQRQLPKLKDEFSASVALKTTAFTVRVRKFCTATELLQILRFPINIESEIRHYKCIAIVFYLCNCVSSDDFWCYQSGASCIESTSNHLIDFKQNWYVLMPFIHSSKIFYAKYWYFDTMYVPTWNAYECNVKLEHLFPPGP
jgi:hypothetical protein